MPQRVTGIDFGLPCQLPEKITNAEGEQTSIVNRYDLGLVKSWTDANLQQTSVGYDNYGRLSEVTRPDQTYSTYTPYSCNTPPCWGVNDLRAAVFRNDYATDGTLEGSEGIYWDGMDRLRYDQTVHAFGTLVYDRILGYDGLGRRIWQYAPVAAAAMAIRPFPTMP